MIVGYNLTTVGAKGIGLAGGRSAVNEIVWTSGRAFVGVTYGGPVAAGAAVRITDAGLATAIVDGDSASAIVGQRVGVAMADGVSGDVALVQVYGPTNVKVAANFAAGAASFTTASAGVLDDSANTTGLTVVGVFAAATTPAATVAGRLSFPYVSAIDNTP